MRIHLLLAFAFVACTGGDGSSTPKPDGPPDIGFHRPVASLKAHTEVSENNWMEIGAADLTCLSTPANDPASTVEVMLTTTVRDFQSTNPVPSSTVTVFPASSVEQTFPGSPFTADANAVVTVRIPIGTKRFGYKMTHSTALDTLLLNQRVDPAMAMQNVDEIRSVSRVTAETLSAFIGISRTVGTGILAGVVRDCADNEVSGFIATVSTTKGAVSHVPGADTYYFAGQTGLPVRHTVAAASSPNGIFMVIELQPTATGYVQVWGYPTEADVAADNLVLIAELEAPVIADTVITGSYEPLRTGI